VLLAIVLDRITQAMGEPRRASVRWWQTGPAGLVVRLLRSGRPAAPPTEAAQPAARESTAH
jgi:glycine betaine/proline transport system permease protein